MSDTPTWNPTFTNDYGFTYDEREVYLRDYLPPIYLKISDYLAIADASCYELHNVFSKIRDGVKNQFVSTALDNAIAKWERRFGIIPNGTDTLEERRYRIAAKLADFPPYTEKYLTKRLDDLCGKNNWRVFYDYELYRIIVQITLESLANNETVLNVVRDIVPANLEVDIQRFRVRHSELVAYTHTDLASHTHDELKLPETFESTEMIS